MKSKLLVFFQFLLIFLIVISANREAWLLLRLLIITVATMIGIWAIYVKRTSLSIFPEPIKEMKLVTSGPYGFIRHPMYTAVLLAMFGFAVGSSLVTWILFVLLLIDLVFKISYEESLLMARFDEYEKYAKNTKRIIPFIW